LRMGEVSAFKYSGDMVGLPFAWARNFLPGQP
jgi:hypothetical protein